MSIGTNIVAPLDSAESIYDKWELGRHAELLNGGDVEFLRWVANRGRFPDDEWTRRFLVMGRLKRKMWKSVGVRPFGWCPQVELRMPAGCTAACVYCNGAKVRRDPHANTRESLFEAIRALRFPETVALCAEWGDPSMHPDIIRAVNKRIEEEWLITRYTFLTNLSLTDAVLQALPYTRSMVVHCTMSEPRHAREIMGYRSENMFEQVMKNIQIVRDLSRTGAVAAKISIVYILQPSTLPHVAAHYRLFRDMEGIAFCRYKPAYKFEGRINHEPEAARQRAMLAELKGRVPYEWTA